MICLILGLVGGAIAAITVYVHWNRGIFKKMGVPTAPAVPFLGVLPTYTRLPSIFDGDSYHLKNYGVDGKFVGVFDGRLAVLLIGDAEMIRLVMQKQSSDFYDRQTYLDEDPSILSLSLINLRGAHWKHVRQVLTPTFTPASLRRMMPLIEQCAVHMVDVCLKNCEKADVVNVRDATNRFSLRTIASIAFGIDFTRAEPGMEDYFIKCTTELFAFFDSYLTVLNFILPDITRIIWKALQFLGIETSLSRAVNTLASLVTGEINRRKRENVTRDDFLQAMMNLEEVPSTKSGERSGLTRDEMIAQCVLFLIAANETTGSTLTFFYIAMAQNPECQERLREELKNVELDGNVEMTTEKLASLSYLEMCLYEAMRIYPAIARTDRVCTVKEGTTLCGIPIPYGMNIGIPIATMHELPEFWPEPERFDPERFKNGVPSEAAFAYLPFGAGPHVCIGERLAKLELRMAIVATFRKFRVELSEYTHLPVKIATTGFRTPIEPVYLRFVESPI